MEFSWIRVEKLSRAQLIQLKQEIIITDEYDCEFGFSDRDLKKADELVPDSVVFERYADKRFSTICQSAIII